jgi:hypothetical protein
MFILTSSKGVKRLVDIVTFLYIFNCNLKTYCMGTINGDSLKDIDENLP